MLNINVIGKQNFWGHNIPVIEGGFGEKNRIILAKTVAEIHNMNVSDVNKLINNNLSNLSSNIDCINVLSLVKNDKKLRESLNLTTREVNQNTKYVYVLSQRGYIRLVAAMSNKNESKWDVMDSFVNDYFKMRNCIDEIAGKFLSEHEVNEILKLTNQNPYIKDYVKILVPPRGKKGKIFKENEINKFLGKINKEVEQYLITNLGVPDLEHIPGFASRYACRLVKECYSFSDELKGEFTVLVGKLLNKRAEVIYDNQLKNSRIVSGFREELKKVKQAIKGYLN